MVITVFVYILNCCLVSMLYLILYTARDFNFHGLTAVLLTLFDYYIWSSGKRWGRRGFCVLRAEYIFYFQMENF